MQEFEIYKKNLYRIFFFLSKCLLLIYKCSKVVKYRDRDMQPFISLYVFLLKFGKFSYEFEIWNYERRFKLDSINLNLLYIYILLLIQI